MRGEDVDFQPCANAFPRCSSPARLQETADSPTARDLLTCGRKWLATFTPFFTEKERRQAGCRHRLFFSQAGLCGNLVFRRRTALDRMGERLPDANRAIGQPNKITYLGTGDQQCQLPAPDCISGLSIASRPDSIVRRLARY
jgi:hypothetical protein